MKLNKNKYYNEINILRNIQLLYLTIFRKKDGCANVMWSYLENKRCVMLEIVLKINV